MFEGSYPADVLSAFWDDHMDIRDGDLETIHQPLDWWGLNYYTPLRVESRHQCQRGLSDGRDGSPQLRGRRLTDIGWEVYEKGLSDLLKDLDTRYPLPDCYITENGACYNDEPQDGVVNDQRRIDYLEKHFGAIADAREAGVPVKGYFLWSLMDNFEWGRRLQDALRHWFTWIMAPRSVR